MGSLPSTNAAIDLKHQVPDLQWADPSFQTKSPIDLLIGADIIPLIMKIGVTKNLCGSLLAQETVFGWVLSGPVPSPTIAAFHTAVQGQTMCPLDQQLRRFWEIEEIPQKKVLSKSDAYCEELFCRTVTRTQSGQYMVTLPFRSEFPEVLTLGASRPAALAMYRSSERRWERNPELKRQYSDVLQEYITLQHAKRVTDLSGPSYYMPHHAVLKPDSTTTKLRVVFNASHATSTGVSLNDVLHPGPALQNDLMILLVRWRFFRYVFNGDLEKMYRQILVAPEHTRFQRIMMRNPESQSMDDIELLTVTFGVNCAPYLAIRT